MKAKPTVLWLMTMVAVVAVGLVAIRTDDPRWATVIFALTILAFCTVTVIAFYHRGACAGFAVFGWAAFFISQPHIRPSEGAVSPAMEAVLQATLTLRWARTITPLGEFLGTPLLIAKCPDGSMFIGSVNNTSHKEWEVPAQSLCTLLCLFSLVAGLVGALIGGFIDRRLGSRHAQGPPV